MKVQAWGISCYVVGTDRRDSYFFATKEARDEIYNAFKTPVEKIRCRMMDEYDEMGEKQVFASAEEYYDAARNMW